MKPSVLIREYEESDFEEICSWWDAAQEPGPPEGAMIPDGTFVLEIDGVPSLSLTVFLTQSKKIAYLEGFISRPGIEKKIRNDLSEILWDYACQFADCRGYKTVIMYAQKPKLVERYERMGMTRAQSGLTALYRSI